MDWVTARRDLHHPRPYPGDIERGPALGPVLEVTVEDVEEAKSRLVRNGCEIIKDEPDFPRCYIRDPFGLIYNLTG